MLNNELSVYIDYLYDNKYLRNVISKKANKEDIIQLINDTINLNEHIKQQNIIDVGSGNGILGVPISILNKKKNVVLVEPRKKKYEFLKDLLNEFKYENITIFNNDIETYIKTDRRKISMVTRGFPNLELLYKILIKNKIEQLISISSENKIRNVFIENNFIKLRKYDIKNRDLLKIFSLESVSRETI